MKKYLLLITLLFCNNTMANFDAPAYQSILDPVKTSPDVVEFFSFYCPPCYQFVTNYPVSETINRTLPPGKKIVKYHVSAMGKFGVELSEAWAIANLTGISDRIEHALFQGVQETHSLNSIDDIKGLFEKFGVTPENYDSAQQSLMVKAFIHQQAELAEALQVTGTPSFYIRGRFLIRNEGVKGNTPDEYVRNFSDLVSQLLHAS